MTGAMRRPRRPREGRDLARARSRTTCWPTGSRSSWSRSPSCSKAVERRCREANKARINAQTARAARGDGRRGRGEAQGVGRPGRHAPALGRRRLALDGQRRGELDRLARHRGGAARRPDAARPRCATRCGSEGFTPRRCCWAWAARASAPRCGRRPSAASRARPSCSSSTRPIRRRSRPSRTRSTSRKTLFIVSSKSGSTLEPNIFKAYFFDRVKQAVGADQAGSRFVAVTDPGSNLEKEAKADGFRHIFPGVKTIGGRYSALSNFGMVPAAVMGLDVERLLDEAERMLAGLRAGRARRGEPGPRARHDPRPGREPGHDKLTLVASPGLHDLGAWLEQLVAESTGKEGKGIIPVDREALGPPEVYGDDRALRLPPARGGARRGPGRGGRRAREGRPARGRASASPRPTTWPRSSSAGRSPPRSRARSWGSTPSTSPTSRPARSPPRPSPRSTRRPASCPAEAPFFEGEGVKLFADEKNARGPEEGRGRRAVPRPRT